MKTAVPCFPATASNCRDWRRRQYVYAGRQARLSKIFATCACRAGLARRSLRACQCAPSDDDLPGNQVFKGGKSSSFAGVVGLIHRPHRFQQNGALVLVHACASFNRWRAIAACQLLQWHSCFIAPQSRGNLRTPANSWIPSPSSAANLHPYNAPPVRQNDSDLSPTPRGGHRIREKEKKEKNKNKQKPIEEKKKKKKGEIVKEEGK